MVGKRRWLLLTSFGLVIFLAYLIWSNPFQILLEVGRFNAVVFLSAVLIDYVSLFLFALSWYLLLKVLGMKVGAWEAAQVTFVSLFAVWMIPIPVGAEIVRAYLVRGEGNSGLGRSIASVVVHKAYYNLAFGAFIAVGALMVTLKHNGLIPVRPELVWFVVAFAAVSSAIFALILSPRLLRAVYERSPDWVRRRFFDRLGDPRMGEGGFPTVVEEIDSAVKALKSKPFYNLLSLLMVAFHWSTGSLTAYMVALSLIHI
mgnify:FL=1